MAKDVKFNIHLKIDGKEQIVTASTNVKELANQLGIARTKGEAFRDALLISTQITQGISNLTSGLQQLTGIMSQYTKAAAAQEQVETQLATVMRQRMDATEADIQSIKNLAAAQQQLGVIGDEVQLAGAQQIATFLNQRSSIETLLPAMNDLLAQQHGLNVSQTDAVGVANLMGKAMQGQTSALRRVGIVFTDAQEQLLKYGDETQRAATLAQVITDNVGHMNAELAKTDAGQAKQTANYFGDLKEKVGSTFATIEPTIVAVAELGLALNAVGTTVTAIKTVTIAIRNLGVVTRLTSTITTAFSAITGTAGTVAAGSAVGVTALGVAVRGLMIATGVGAAIAALTLVIGKLTEQSDAATASQQTLTKAQEQAQAVAEAGERAYKDASASLTLNIARTKDFNGTKEQEKKIVAELNSTYGATMGYFSSVSQWYNALVANSKDYCRQLVIEARTRKLADQIDEERAKQEDIRFETDEKGNKTVRKFSTKRQTERVIDVDKTAMNGGLPVYREEEIVGSSEQEKNSRELTNSIAREKNLTKELNSLVNESRNLVMPVKGTPAPPTGTPTTHNTYHTTGTNTTTDTKQPAAAGSIDYYEERLAELRKQIYATADESVAASLQATYKETEAQMKAAKIRIGLEEPQKEETKTYMEQLQDQLTAARQELDNALTVEARVEASAKVDDIQRQINEATSGKVTIAAEVEPSYIEHGSLADKRASYGNAQARAGRIQQDYEIGIIGKDEALKQLVELNAELFKMGMEPVHIEVETEDVERATAQFDAAVDAVGAMGSSFSSLGRSLELPELNVMGTIAQAIATMTAGYAAATEQAAATGPWAWVAFAATGLAQLAAMISSVKGMGAFAQGGVVSGPTLALVGEYAGASNNPEVIAPLDKLRSMIQPGGVAGNVRFEIEGRKLVGAISNETRISGKSGRKSNI